MTKPDFTPYLLANLNANPVYDAGEIVARRERLLGRHTATAAAQVTPASTAKKEARQAAVAKKLETVRKAFWTAPLPTLKEQLDRLPTAEFPDLDMAAARLRQVALYRPEFPCLAHHARTNSVLFNAFKAVVVLPPSQAGATRERANRSLARIAPKKLRRMIAMMKRDFPQLYQLEADWLKQVENLKKYAEGASTFHWAPLVLKVGVLVSVLLVLLFIALATFSDLPGAGVVAIVVVVVIRVLLSSANNE